MEAVFQNLDSQSHLIYCEAMENQNVLESNVPDYDHLFLDFVEDPFVVVKILKQKLEQRKKLLKTVKLSLPTYWLVPVLS